MTDYDSAPSEVGGALGKDSEMLKTVIESRTRPYIDLMNELSGKTAFNKMVDLSLDPEKTKLFFELDPREREQRSALEAKLDRLVKAQTIIAKSI